MLSTLKNRNQEEVEQVLASVTQRFLPQPRDEFLDVGVEQLRELQDSVLSEIRDRLKLSTTQETAESRRKVLEFLIKEISAPVTSGKRGEQARMRLGQQGDLRPDLYQIKLGDFRHELEKRGIRRSHIEDALHRPHGLQHLLPEKIRSGEFPALSLYIKHHGELQSPDRFTLLVQAQREGDRLTINSAWRIYHVDVDLSKVHEPVDILRAFVDVYGLYCRVGNSAPAKFFLYEEFRMASGQQATEIIRADSPTDVALEASSLIRVRNFGVIEVAVAYIINMSWYISDLRKHNVELYSS
jgi:hypothetical protein